MEVILVFVAPLSGFDEDYAGFLRPPRRGCSRSSA